MYYPNNYPGQMNPMIVASAVGDVNGDKVPDYVYLTGAKTPGSPYVQMITLVIRDGRTGMVNNIPLKSNAGYNPGLFLGDFTGDGVKDIMISIASGGSGGIMFYYIYSYIGNMPQLLFDYEVFNNEYRYRVEYKDNYKVEVTNLTKHIKYIIDISLRDPEYLNEIYDPNGKLKAPIEGWVDPLSGLYPVDFDMNGIYELLAYQAIAGRYHADGLGYILTRLKWNGRMFEFMDQSLAIFGTSY